MDTLPAILALVPAITWLYALILLPWKVRGLPRLADVTVPPGALPTLSIVIAARNEGPHIKAALASLLAQQYAGLEIIVVDDRSEDDTHEILRRMEAADARLRVIHVTELPDGWLGKNHALQKGLDASRGEFVLFTDADVHFKTGTLERAVHFAREQELDHLASLPHLVGARPSMQLLVPAFSIFFLMTTQPWKAGDARSERHIGVGAFNLVRRRALEAVNGFEPIRMRPDDDLRLAALLKRHRARAGFILSDQQVSVSWYTTAGEMIRGLEKNAFAHFDYRPLATSAMMLLTIFLVTAPFAGILLLPSITGWISLLAASCMLLLAVLVARFLETSLLWGILFPAGSLLVVYATLRSMFITLLRDGITWRGTFYSLQRLKSGR